MSKHESYIDLYVEPVQSQNLSTLDQKPWL